jgi:hypothetical protein
VLVLQPHLILFNHVTQVKAKIHNRNNNKILYLSESNSKSIELSTTTTTTTNSTTKNAKILWNLEGDYFEDAIVIPYVLAYLWQTLMKVTFM